MALITFISDFGNVDHYVAAVKARLFSINAVQQVIDISHHIERYDVAHGSFVLKSVFKEFPVGTVHLCAINSFNQKGEPYIAVKLENHFFVGADNGLFSLITESDPEEIIELEAINRETAFPAKDIFAMAAARLAQGVPLATLGKPLSEIKKMIGRKVRATKRQIAGHVIRVDHYGNLITNIEKDVFDILRKGNTFSIIFAREALRNITETYDHSEGGDCFVIFNSLGLLEIGINKGNAAELLGMGYDSPVTINFHIEDV